MTPDRPPILVLGIGNELFTDEGLGVVAARRIAQSGLPGVEVLDGATLGLALLPEIADRDAVLLLDAIVAGYVDGDLGRDELVAAGHDPATVDRVLRMVDLAEYKRRQSAPGPKISFKAFGRDRRMPVTNRFRESRDR